MTELFDKTVLFNQPLNIELMSYLINMVDELCSVQLAIKCMGRGHHEGTIFCLGEFKQQSAAWDVGQYVL